jgi:hypothetical protein
LFFVCKKDVHVARPPQQRSIDVDVDIGAEAVDYSAIAKAESLSGLEVEMRKLEGIVQEIVEELNYLKRREAKMRDTNGMHALLFCVIFWLCLFTRDLIHPSLLLFFI